MEPIADSNFFSPLQEETHFYFVRHGQSEGNAKGMFQGRLDLPLDETGREQARAAAKWLMKEGVDALFSSPLARAAQTAGEIALACSLGEVRTDPLFAEIDTGIFTGLGFSASRERYPDVYAAFEGHSWEAVPGAERAEALYGRAMQAWSMLRDHALSGSKAVACVSHGGFMQWLIRATFGCHSWMPLLTTANCGIFELLVDPKPGGPAYLHWRHMNFQAPEPSAPQSGSV
jgi:broad specificity phosphatase PhoE